MLVWWCVTKLGRTQRYAVSCWSLSTSFIFNQLITFLIGLHYSKRNICMCACVFLIILLLRTNPRLFCATSLTLTLFLSLSLSLSLHCWLSCIAALLVSASWHELSSTLSLVGGNVATLAAGPFVGVWMYLLLLIFLSCLFVCFLLRFFLFVLRRTFVGGAWILSVLCLSSMFLFLFFVWQHFICLFFVV